MTDIPSFPMSVPGRLGTTARLDGDGLVISVDPAPTTTHLGVIRASVLAFVADAVGGVPADHDPNFWAFTSDLSLRMRPIVTTDRIEARGRILREGRRTIISDVTMTTASGLPIARSLVGFARLPHRDGDPPKPPFDSDTLIARWADKPPIAQPLRDAAGVVAIDPSQGAVEILVTDDVRNPAGALQGAMVALVAEAAAEDLASHRAGHPMLVTELDVRYLSQARDGLVRTCCEPLGDAPDSPVLIELVDATDRVVTTVLARAVSQPFD